MNRCTRVHLKEWPNVLVFENGDGSGEECRGEYDLSTPAGRSLFARRCADLGFGTVAEITAGLLDLDGHVEPCLLLSRD